VAKLEHHMEWLVGMGVFGVWCCVYSLSKIVDTNAALAKNLGGLRYQIEKMEARLATITSEIYAIKHNTSRHKASGESWWSKTFDAPEDGDSDER